MFSFFAHIFLPQPSNNHKAKILQPKGITFLLSLLTVTQILLIFFSTVRPDVLGFATDISAEKLFEITNQKRLENGIPPLTLNQNLSQAAAGKAQDMFGNNYWAHISPTGKTPWNFIIGSGYQYVYAGENLAKDFQDASGVINAWMDSPSHKDNLLQKKYKDVGFAVVNGRLQGEETTLIVQMFGTKSPQVLAQKAANEINTPIPTALPSLIPPPSTIPQINENISPTTSIINTTKWTEFSKTSIGKTKGIIVKITPKIDIFSLSKEITAFSIMLLIVVLLIDAFIVAKQKIVRISGNNFAHILLLSSLLATILLLNRGSII